MARVILHSFDPVKDYYNYCEFAKNPRRSSNERLSGNHENLQIESDYRTNEPFINSGYKIIPNPNDGTFRLYCNSNELIKCELYDISGRIVESGNYKPSANAVLFHLDYLPKGIYHSQPSFVSAFVCVSLRLCPHKRRILLQQQTKLFII